MGLIILFAGEVTIYTDKVKKLVTLLHDFKPTAWTRNREQTRTAPPAVNKLTPTETIDLQKKTLKKA